MNLKEFDPAIGDEFGLIHPNESKARKQYLYTDSAVDLSDWA